MRADRIGFVFQAFYLLPELSLLENVMLPAWTRWNAGFQRRRHEARARELIRRVGLEARARHRPAELSGGEQQRAAIARALMNDPDVVLADEPTGNLDSATGAQVLACLFDLVGDTHRTVVLVTHNDEIARRCDRRLSLCDGRLDARD
jgi:predicted ABC-type transport system involved in lysophospholipase L1 biosynthesis ATPase subunit